MIEITGYPVKEEIAESMTRLFTQMTKTLGDLQYLVKQFVDGTFYMTQEEVASYLRCNTSDIPKLKRYRLGTTKILYKRCDVDAFVESKKIGDNL